MTAKFPDTTILPSSEKQVMAVLYSDEASKHMKLSRHVSHSPGRRNACVCGRYCVHSPCGVTAMATHASPPTMCTHLVASLPWRRMPARRRYADLRTTDVYQLFPIKLPPERNPEIPLNLKTETSQLFAQRPVACVLAVGYCMNRRVLRVLSARWRV